MTFLKEPSFMELEEKKSRFLASAWPVQSPEEVRQRVKDEKRKHPKASHVCSAFVLASGLSGSSDDGEPHGTAGRPMLQVLQGLSVVDCCVLVTRYFGGTLLGTGGLVRAYSGAVKAVLSTALLEERQELIIGQICVSYPQFDRIKYELERLEAKLTIDYQEKITINYQAPLHHKEALDQLVQLLN